MLHSGGSRFASNILIWRELRKHNLIVNSRNLRQKGRIERLLDTLSTYYYLYALWNSMTASTPLRKISNGRFSFGEWMALGFGRKRDIAADGRNRH